MREFFETYGGVILASIITAVILAGFILLLAAGDGSSDNGALNELILQFFRSISGG